MAAKRPQIGLWHWLRTHDPGLRALRRAGRAAIVMPATFALGDRVIGSPTLATFAAFGSFAMLLLVDFTGPMRDRLQAQAALSVVCGAFVCLGTLASNSDALATVAMAIVAFAVLFAGVVSSVLASATTSLLLSFILPVSLAGPASSIPDRLAGWGLASGAALLAIGLLWPAPTREPLRGRAIEACRALAMRLRTDVARAMGAESSPQEHAAVVARAEAAVGALHDEFFATPNRPTGLSTAARAIVRLVDELRWLRAIIVESAPRPAGSPGDRFACAVKSASASVLEAGADLLDMPRDSRDRLQDALLAQHQALLELEQATTRRLPGPEAAGTQRDPSEQRIESFVASLDPSFRAQELSFVVSQIAANVDLAAAAERRTWLERLVGRQPEGLAGRLAATRERASAHVERHSVWLHNSVRGAVALAVAVLVAKLTGVQHAFWVVFGTLSVLRSNALSIGENALRGLSGTVAGFIVGAALVALIGTNTTVLWLLLPPAVLLAGLAPAAVSFAAGQGAFTLTLLILFNILEPAGWRIGLVRVEDVALGSAVSLVVGLLFWPRGAGAALGTALSEAYADSVRYLSGAVAFGMGRCDECLPSRPVPEGEATRAAAAARRLDDAFRGYLAERGAKPVPLAEVTSLVNGVAGLRLAGDAVLDLWQHDDLAGGDRTAARRQLEAAAGLIEGWYDGFAAALAGRGNVPEPMPRDGSADARLVEAVSHDLRSSEGLATATAVRMIWTRDHVDAARRLQAALVAPAKAASVALTADPLHPSSAWQHFAVRLAGRSAPPAGRAAATVPAEDSEAPASLVPGEGFEVP
ncbi:MAG: FUSC family protein [Solirubrobacteraceae bacterium]|jgi:uncharacterized membrane protein YccC